jgi:hypothetical protein
MNKKIPIIITVASVIVYCSSLFFDCFCAGGSCHGSFMVLLVGWLGGIAAAGACMTWFANPFIWAAWVVNIKAPKGTILLSSLATLGCLSFLFFDKIATDEGGTPHEITELKIGYWLWLASPIIILIGNAITRIFLSSGKQQ